jgi:hypothetical protein
MYLTPDLVPERMTGHSRRPEEQRSPEASAPVLVAADARSRPRSRAVLRETAAKRSTRTNLLHIVVPLFLALLLSWLVRSLGR